MTISSWTQRHNYTAAGGQVAFAFSFEILAESDLAVYSGGVLKTINTHYTVSASPWTSGGTVTFLIAPGAGIVVSLLRVVPLTQVTDYIEGAKFSAETAENTLDKLTMLVQDLHERAGRSPTLPASSALGPLTLPTGAGKTIRWNGAGTELEVVDPDPGVGAVFTDITVNGNILGDGGVVVSGIADIKSKWPRVDIRAFGAVPNDNSVPVQSANVSAIQAAADYAEANEGILYIPPGNFHITSSGTGYGLSVKCGITGEGPNLSRITNNGTGHCMKIEGLLYYARFENFALIGNASSKDGLVMGIDGVSATDEVAYSTFSHVDCHQHGGHGLVRRLSWATRYHDCKFHYNKKFGVYFYDDAAAYHNNIIFLNCESRWNGGTGDNTGYIGGGVCLSGGGGSVCWWGGVVESNNGWGFVIGSSVGILNHVDIMGCHFEDNPAKNYGATPVGGNVVLLANHLDVVVRHCLMAYGAEVGKTGYNFFVDNEPNFHYWFKEYGNFTDPVGAGTNIEYNQDMMVYDWNHVYVTKQIGDFNRVLGLQTRTILSATATGAWSIDGKVHIRPWANGMGGIYPFRAGYDTGIGSLYVNTYGPETTKVKVGVSSAKSTGGTIAHGLGLGVAPLHVSVLPQFSGCQDLYVTADATNITVNFGGGGSGAFWWRAEYIWNADTLPTIAWVGTDLKVTFPVDHHGHVEFQLSHSSSPPGSFSINRELFSTDFCRRAKPEP